MRINPLTYGNEALRQLLFPGSSSVLPVGSSLVVLALFSALMFGWAFIMANRRSTKPAASWACVATGLRTYGRLRHLPRGECDAERRQRGADCHRRGADPPGEQDGA